MVSGMQSVQTKQLKQKRNQSWQPHASASNLILTPIQFHTIGYALWLKLCKNSSRHEPSTQDHNNMGSKARQPNSYLLKCPLIMTFLCTSVRLPPGPDLGDKNSSTRCTIALLSFARTAVAIEPCYPGNMGGSDLNLMMMCSYAASQHRIVTGGSGRFVTTPYAIRNRILRARCHAHLYNYVHSAKSARRLHGEISCWPSSSSSPVKQTRPGSTRRNLLASFGDTFKNT